jgi:hypothetical protein
MVVFNIAAIAQLLIIVILVGLLHVIFGLFGFDLINHFGKRTGLVDGLLIVTYLAFYIDVRGLKGKLFWTPVWLLTLFATILFVLNPSFVGYSAYTLSGLILVPFVFWWMVRRNILSKWGRAKNVMAEIDQMGPSRVENEKFWMYLSGTYYKPGWLYFKGYDVWKFLFGGVLSKEDVAEHYLKLVNFEALREIQLDPYTDWMNQIRKNLMSESGNQQFPNHERDIDRIGRILSRMPKILEKIVLNQEKSKDFLTL